jgi:hypothetical protein
VDIFAASLGREHVERPKDRSEDDVREQDGERCRTVVRRSRLPPARFHLQARDTRRRHSFTYTFSSCGSMGRSIVEPFSTRTCRPSTISAITGSDRSAHQRSHKTVKRPRPTGGLSRGRVSFAALISVVRWFGRTLLATRGRPRRLRGPEKTAKAACRSRARAGSMRMRNESAVATYETHRRRYHPLVGVDVTAPGPRSGVTTSVAAGFERASPQRPDVCVR